LIDTSWFLDELRGDGLIVRMHIDLRRGRAPSTEIRAYSYWHDDMAYNGFEAVYRHSESSKTGISVPEWSWFPSPCDGWGEYIADQAKSWSALWQESSVVVCTIGPVKRNPRRLPTGHPLALTHLARFQAAVTLTHPDGLGWGVSADIVSRRLEGIVRSNLKDWRKLIG
jgi:hypothetical protein